MTPALVISESEILPGWEHTERRFEQTRQVFVSQSRPNLIASFLTSLRALPDVRTLLKKRTLVFAALAAADVNLETPGG
jgi:hypothetical protein